MLTVNSMTGMRREDIWRGSKKGEDGRERGREPLSTRMNGMTYAWEEGERSECKRARRAEPKLMVVNGFDVVMNRERRIYSLACIWWNERRWKDKYFWSTRNVTMQRSVSIRFVALLSPIPALFCSLCFTDSLLQSINRPLLDAIWKNSTMARLFPLFSDFNRALLELIHSFQLSLNSFHFSFSFVLRKEISPIH